MFILNKTNTIKEASELLNVTQKTVYNKIEKYLIYKNNETKEWSCKIL